MMGDDSSRHNGQSARDTTVPEQAVTEGWDRNAFWVPTLDRRGAFLAGVVLLFALHFNELFGVHTLEGLLFGWLPINLFYYVGLGVLHVGFLLLLYVHWPESEVASASGSGGRSK